MQSRAMLFLHLFGRDNSAAKVCELHQLLLDCLQPFIPLSVGDVSCCSIPTVTPELLVCFLNGSDLFPETANLVPKNP